MAAKEKTQQAQQTKAAPTQPAAVPDLLMDFDAPASEDAPPPSYDTNFLQPPPPPASVMDAPPAFDMMENQLFPPPPPIESVMPPPPPMENLLQPPSEPPGGFMMPPSAPAASAPSFEDLLGGGGGGGGGGGALAYAQQHDCYPVPPPLQPPSMEAAAPAALDIDESILNALEPAEREAFLEEQRRIMEQIEKERTGKDTSSAAARAAAFDQRSSAAVAQVAASYEGSGRSRRAAAPKSSSRSMRSETAASSSGTRTVNLGEGNEVPLHGQEKTEQAIRDGTAVIVKCMSCNNWMQVTEAAELMFCPICQVVCPVEKAGAATTADMEAAAQMAADAELAELLQKEEYEQAGGGQSRSARRRQGESSQVARAPVANSTADGGQSWYDWLVGAQPAPEASTSTSNPHTTEARPRTGLISAQTGEEAGLGLSRSYDESEGLMGSGGGGARVAAQKSMFACVADSISTAATQMTAYNLSQDEEGNVHGVDSSSLLAMPDVSRQRESS